MKDISISSWNNYFFLHIRKKSGFECNDNIFGMNMEWFHILTGDRKAVRVDFKWDEGESNKILSQYPPLMKTNWNWPLKPNFPNENDTKHKTSISSRPPSQAYWWFLDHHIQNSHLHSFTPMQSYIRCLVNTCILHLIWIISNKAGRKYLSSTKKIANRTKINFESMIVSYMFILGWKIWHIKSACQNVTRESDVNGIPCKVY